MAVHVGTSRLLTGLRETVEASKLVGAGGILFELNDQARLSGFWLWSCQKKKLATS